MHSFHRLGKEMTLLPLEWWHLAQPQASCATMYVKLRATFAHERQSRINYSKSRAWRL